MWSIRCMLNTFVVLPFSTAVGLYLWPMRRDFEAQYQWNAVWVSIFIIKILIFVLFYDIVFYSLHRLLHAIPFLYRNVHHHHHHARLNGDAFHASVFEHIFINVWPFIIVCHYVGFTYTMFTLWGLLALANTTYTHTKARTNHYLHHRRRDNGDFVNFGVGFMFCDKISGTFVAAE
mgnify:CR=1 FL=1